MPKEDYVITYSFKSFMRSREHDWVAFHKDYYGDEDTRYFTGPSADDVILQIEEYEE